jgi:hypothetical protein
MSGDSEFNSGVILTALARFVEPWHGGKRK